MIANIFMLLLFLPIYAVAISPSDIRSVDHNSYCGKLFS